MEINKKPKRIPARGTWKMGKESNLGILLSARVGSMGRQPIPTSVESRATSLDSNMPSFIT
jgi:hypothetical protein